MKTVKDPKDVFLLDVLTKIEKQAAPLHSNKFEYDRERAFLFAENIAANLCASGIKCEASADNIRVQYPEKIGAGSFSVNLYGVKTTLDYLKINLNYDPNKHYFGPSEKETKAPRQVYMIGFKSRPMFANK